MIAQYGGGRRKSTGEGSARPARARAKVHNVSEDRRVSRGGLQRRTPEEDHAEVGREMVHRVY